MALFRRKTKSDRKVSVGVQTNDISDTKIRIEYPRSSSVPNPMHLTLYLEQEFAARIPPGLSRSYNSSNVVILERKYSNGHYCTIWKARLREDHDQRVRLVARISKADDGAEAWVCRMREEALKYAVTLNGLQGKTIPNFYGLYSGEIGGRPVVCMLVENCGSALGEKPNLTQEQRVEVFKRFFALHQARYVHSGTRVDFNNVLLDETRSEPFKVRLVDFERLKGNHRCGWRAIPSREAGRPTDRREYDCDELREVERKLRIWKVEPSNRTPRKGDDRRKSSRREGRPGPPEGETVADPGPEPGDVDLLGGDAEAEENGGDYTGGGQGGPDEFGLDDAGGDVADAWPQENEEDDVKVVPEPAAPANDKVEKKKKKGNK